MAAIGAAYIAWLSSFRRGISPPSSSPGA